MRPDQARHGIGIVVSKRIRERVLHAVFFEGIALVTVAPAMAFVLDKDVLDTGLLTVAISCTAMLWNMLYNTLFDAWLVRRASKKTSVMRVGHAFGFEVGLIVLVIPMAAFWLHITLWQAFLMEIGLLLFLLPYTYLYNLMFDALLEKCHASKQARS